MYFYQLNEYIYLKKMVSLGDYSTGRLFWIQPRISLNEHKKYLWDMFDNSWKCISEYCIDCSFNFGKNPCSIQKRFKNIVFHNKCVKKMIMSSETVKSIQRTSHNLAWMLYCSMLIKPASSQNAFTSLKKQHDYKWRMLQWIPTKPWNLILFAIQVFMVWLNIILFSTSLVGIEWKIVCPFISVDRIIRIILKII